MRISAQCDYACRALLELALQWPNKDLMQIQAISKRQDIPIKYLVHILIQLKKIGLVTSARGKEGGYSLAKEPKDIALGKVIRQVSGPLLSLPESTKDKTVFAAIWKDLERTMAKLLDKITFEDILNKAKGTDGTINYHI